MIRMVFVLALFCSLNVMAQEFDGERVLKHLKTLSSDEFEGRGMDTPGSVRTQEYIAYHFDSLGVEKFDSSWTQPFNVMHSMKLKKLHGQNVLGFVPGTEYPDKWIVVSSHHDHMGIMDGKIYNGADDNASGTCALFAVAEHLAKYPPKHSVALVAFDGEEVGLIGSKHFVANPPMEGEILLNINMDMISRSDKNEIYLCGQAHNPEIFAFLNGVDTSGPIEIKFGHDGSDKKDNWSYASDHGSFLKNDIPIIYFGVEDHKDYHEPSDDYENVHHDFYLSVVQLVVKCLFACDMGLSQ